MRRGWLFLTRRCCNRALPAPHPVRGLHTAYDQLATPFADSGYARSNAQRNGVFNYDLNGAYTRSFTAQPQRKWEMLAQYSRNSTATRYQLDQYAGRELFQSTPEYQERSANEASTAETTVQTDYTHPLAPGQLRSAALRYTSSRLTYTANLNGSYRFKRGICVQVYGGYTSPGIQL